MFYRLPDAIKATFYAPWAMSLATMKIKNKMSLDNDNYISMQKYKPESVTLTSA